MSLRIRRFDGALPALRWTALTLALAACGWLTACQEKAAAQGGPPPGPPPVSVAPAAVRQVQDTDDFSGRLEAVETVELRPRVAGYVERVHFREGQEVRKGDLLFTIDAGPFRVDLAKAQAQLASAMTQAELAKTEQARAQKLLDLKAVSQQEYDQLASGLRNADANVKAAESAVAAAQLNIGYTQLRAPITGRVSRANVTAGNYVNVGDPVLTTIVSLDRVYAYFDASEEVYLKYAKQFRPAAAGGKPGKGQTVFMGLANETGYPNQGVIDFVDNRLNTQTGAIRARAAFDNTDRRYTPGLFARIRLYGGGAYEAVMTPDRAIGTDQNKKFVLVIGDGGIAQAREVQLGTLVDGMRVIRTGLKGGELVVVNGLQRVRPGAPVTPQRLEIDTNGMPIEPPPAAPGGPGGPDAKGGAKSGGAKDAPATKPAAKDAPATKPAEKSSALEQAARQG